MAAKDIDRFSGTVSVPVIHSPSRGLIPKPEKVLPPPPQVSHVQGSSPLAATVLRLGLLGGGLLMLLFVFFPYLSRTIIALPTAATLFFQRVPFISAPPLTSNTPIPTLGFRAHHALTGHFLAHQTQNLPYNHRLPLHSRVRYVKPLHPYLEPGSLKMIAARDHTSHLPIAPGLLPSLQRPTSQSPLSPFSSSQTVVASTAFARPLTDVIEPTIGKLTLIPASLPDPAPVPVPFVPSLAESDHDAGLRTARNILSSESGYDPKRTQLSLTPIAKGMVRITASNVAARSFPDETLILHRPDSDSSFLIVYRTGSL